MVVNVAAVIFARYGHKRLQLNRSPASAGLSTEMLAVNMVEKCVSM